MDDAAARVYLRTVPEALLRQLEVAWDAQDQASHQSQKLMLQEASQTARGSIIRVILNLIFTYVFWNIDRCWVVGQ